jgi:UDP-N-acetyl-D-galactosamine dehydrogenase
MKKNHQIAVIGLGYVGLPLAVEFAKKFPVVGFDINQDRIDELNEGHDPTLEVKNVVLQSVLHRDIELVEMNDNTSTSSVSGLTLTTKVEDIKDANIYIIAVPTPIDKHNRPDLTPLIKSSETIGKVLKDGDIVIYESTVYPGATEEDCIPILERVSGKIFNTDFFVGYSPERINPGDKVNTLTTIKKVTSGSTPEIAERIDRLYNTILLNGTHKASSIKVAEASKIIENAQRDLNISFVNELALIFDRMGIDTNEVIEAAGTKWNFLKFKPGLVGGHCIGIDPYYLAFKAEELGYYPQVIRSGRRVNNNMGHFVADKVIKLMIQKGQQILNSNVLVLGITFKENCPDIRNSGVINVIKEIKEFGCKVDIYDPWADKAEVKTEYDLDTINSIENINKQYDGIVLAVAHEQFLKFDLNILKRNEKTVVYDVKGVLGKGKVDGRL